MPATVTFTRPTFTDNDNPTAAQFNAVTAASATVPDAAAGTLGTIKLAGDLSAGTADAPEIGANKVTLAKMAQLATGTVLGRTTAGTGNVEALDLTAAGAALLAAVNAAAQRALLGLASMALQAADAVAMTGGSAALDAYAANPNTLAYAGSVAVDFALTAKSLQTITLTGNLTLTTTNLAAGRVKLLRIVGDGSNRTLTFPATWKFMNGAAPTSLAANKEAELSLTSWGTTDADVHAYYGAQS